MNQTKHNTSMNPKKNRLMRRKRQRLPEVRAYRGSVVAIPTYTNERGLSNNRSKYTP